MKKTLKFLKEHKQFTFFGILAILIILAAVFAPVLTGGVDPLKGSLTDALEAPSKAHIFGTDKMGRDIYARVIYGARASLTSTFGVVVLIFLGFRHSLSGGRACLLHPRFHTPPLRYLSGKQILFTDIKLKIVPLPCFLTEHRRVDKVQGVCFGGKLIDTVADGRQLTHYPVKFGVGFFAELIALYHFSKERFF